MTETQIRCFLAVCETMSFSQAANAIYVSQPAVSRAVSKLEEELDTKLFAATSGGLMLTPAGELFRDFSQTLRRDYDALLKELFRIKTQRMDTVRLGCPETWNPAFFARPLEDCFASALPDYRLLLEAHKLSELLQGLQSGAMDAVISHEFYPPAITGMRSTVLTQTGTGIVYAKEAFPEPVTFEALAEAGFLLYDRDIERRFGAVIQEICRQRGVAAHISGRPSLIRALFDVSRGGGVMLFTRWDSMIDNYGCGFFPLDFTLPVRLMYMSARVTPALRRFIQASQTIRWDA